MFPLNKIKQNIDIDPNHLDLINMNPTMSVFLFISRQKSEKNVMIYQICLHDDTNESGIAPVSA